MRKHGVFSFDPWLLVMEMRPIPGLELTQHAERICARGQTSGGANQPLAFGSQTWKMTTFE